MVVAAIEVERRVRLGLGLQGFPGVVETRFQNREQPRKRCTPIYIQRWRGQFLLVPYPGCDVHHIACVHAGFSPERSSRRHPSIAEQAAGLQAGRHYKLQRYRDPSLDHAVMHRRIDGRVLSADTMMNSVSFSRRRHSTMDGTPLTVISAIKPEKTFGTSDFRFKKYGHPGYE